MTEQCTMGVGCNEYGVCYAEAHGQPEQCPLYVARSDQPDLPPELMERVVETIKLCRKNAHSYRVKELAKQGLWPESNWWPSEEVIARAVAPMLIAHGRELEKAEVVAWMRELATHSTKYGPTTIADNIESGHFARWAEAHGRNGHRSKP